MSNLKRTVMLRVKAIRLMRPFASDAAAAVVLFFVALYGIGHEVWVAKVVANMPPVFDIPALTQFAITAFVNTEFVVQVLAVLVVGAAVWLARTVAISLADALIHSFAPTQA